MRQVVIRQFAMCQQRVDVLQTGPWAIAHGNGHGAIEMHNWRRLNSYQLFVKRNNLPPESGGQNLVVRRDCYLGKRETATVFKVSSRCLRSVTIFWRVTRFCRASCSEREGADR